MILKTPKFRLFRQLLWAATLAFGFGTLWFVLALLLGTLALDDWRGPGNRDWPDREELAVRRDGRVLIKSTPRGNKRQVSYRDLSGNAEPAPPDADVVEAVYLTGAFWMQSSWLSELESQTRLRPFVDPQHPGIIWYFVHDGARDGAGYFAGYVRSSNQPVGFIGESGFRSDRPPPLDRIPVRSALMVTIPFWSPSRFTISQGRVLDYGHFNSPIPPSWVYVPSGNRLRLVDLRTRTVRTAFQSAEPIEALGYCPQASTGRDHPALVVRTTRTIISLNSDHEIIRSFTIPSESVRTPVLTWYGLADGQSVAEFSQSWRTEADENIAPRLLFQVAPDGAIRSRIELSLASGMLIWKKQPEAVLLSYAAPVPVILPFLQWFFVSIINQAGFFAPGLHAMLESSWPSLLAVTLLGLALAIAAWRRSSTFGLPGRDQVAWAIFVFLFGIPGYVGYRLHRRWPLRAICPHCHAPAPRDREACAACQTPFPVPTLKGIEVFA